MKDILFLPAVMMILASAVSCDGDYINPSAPDMVVEGWIEDGGYPVVILTQSVPISEEWDDVDDLNNYVIKWATVRVSCGTDTVTLTGKVDRDYFPPYIYTTGDSRVRGRAGGTYSLTADYKGFHATAVTTIPQSPPDIVSSRVEKCEGTDSLHRIVVSFTDNADEKNWYQFFVRRGTGTGQFFAAYLGSVDDAVVNGTADYTVYNRSDIREKDGSPYFKTGEEVAVRLSQVDSLSYLFWDDYTKTVSSSSNLFFAPYSSIRSNVTGAAGYWCGMNSRTVRLIINN